MTATGHLLGAPGVTAAEWDALALAARDVFATREWLETWQRHEPAPHGPLTVVSRRADGTLAGLLPLGRHRRLPRVLRPLGVWPPPTQPVVCAEADTDAVVRDVTRQLAVLGGWDVLELDAVPCEQPWTEHLTGVTLSSHSSRVIDLAGRDWEEILASATRNARSYIRRRDRHLRDRYAVRYRMADERSLRADVDLFLELHWARWGGDVNVFAPHRAPVLHEFAELALARGWLALWVLELDDVPVAAYLNFRFAGRETYMLSGWDAAYRADSVSSALLFHTIREAAAAGMAEFDFMRGDEEYKSRLPHRNRPVAHLALSRSLPGTLAVGARVAGRGLAETLRSSSLNERRRRLRSDRQPSG